MASLWAKSGAVLVKAVLSYGLVYVYVLSFLHETLLELYSWNISHMKQLPELYC